MTFSLPLIRGHRSCMSGGGVFFTSPLFTISYLLDCLPGRSRRYMNHAVEVSAEAPVPIALALHELDQALLLQEVQVALDGPWASGETSGQGLHAWPAQAGLVVGEIGEGAVGGYHLRGNACQDQVVDLGYTGKPRTHRHRQPP